MDLLWLRDTAAREVGPIEFADPRTADETHSTVIGLSHWPSVFAMTLKLKRCSLPALNILGLLFTTRNNLINH